MLPLSKRLARTMRDTLTESEFHRHILEAAARCIPQLDTGWRRGLLRSSELLTGEFNGQLAGWQVDEVVQRRSGHCSRMSVESILNHPEFTESRLIGCDCRDQTWYGVASVESRTFFDPFDFPSWDSWLAMLGLPYPQCPDWLICWTPASCLSYAQWGLRVSVCGRSWLAPEGNSCRGLNRCQQIFVKHFPHFVTTWTPVATIEKVRAGEVSFL